MANKIQRERQESDLMSYINGALLFEITDKVMKTASITAIKIADDLSSAKVYVDCRDRSKIKGVVEKLNKNKGVFRGIISNKWKYFKLPNLNFVVDESIDYAAHIEKLITDTKKGE